MTRTEFAIVMILIAAAIFVMMWWGWRARARRAAAIRISEAPIVGEIIASFASVQYVSTTPLGKPLDRASITGLAYKGAAVLEVATDGVSLQVAGERPVLIPAADVLGASRADGRVGKAVEAGGISVLEWRALSGEELESGFRFQQPGEQREFAAAVATLTNKTFALANQADAKHTANSEDTTQEDA